MALSRQIRPPNLRPAEPPKPACLMSPSRRTSRRPRGISGSSGRRRRQQPTTRPAGPRTGGHPASRLGPAPRDSAGPPAVPAAAMPMPAIRLPATRRPGHHMRDPGHDLVIASRAAVPFHRPRPGHRPHHVLVPVRAGRGPAVHIAQPGAQPMRLRPGTLAARFSSWHGFQLRRAGIRCSRSRAGRCNRA